jgi:hypothetical protein
MDYNMYKVAKDLGTFTPNAVFHMVFTGSDMSALVSIESPV